jgi:glycine/D-amino acid oxidase-like deaminating enzyme
VEVHFDTEVLGWSRIADRLCVQTNRGELACDLLVNATGPWAGHFGRLPIRPYNRHLFATAPMAEVDPGWPCVWDTQGGLYFRPESGGLLLSVCDETPAEPGAYHEDPAILERLAEKVRSTQPDLGEFGIRSNWVGQRAFAPDRRFVIGFDPRDDRVFHVAALGGHGVTASYSVGRIAADMIAGQRVEGVGAFSPSRLKEPIGGQDFLLY